MWQDIFLMRTTFRDKNKKRADYLCSVFKIRPFSYTYCGHTTAGQISLGHLGLPSSGQHLFEQLPITIPLPEIPFNCSLESLLLRKFFIF